VEALLGNTLNDEFGFSTFKVDRGVQSMNVAPALRFCVDD